jgi:signal transduction histidine kinase
MSRGIRLPDVILAAGLSGLVLGSLWYWTIIPIVLLVTAPLAWRRRYPMMVFGAQVLGIAVTGGELQPELPAFVAIVVGVYSVAAYHESAAVSLGVLLAFAVAITVVFGDVAPPIPEPLTALAIVVPLWLAGNQIRLSRQRADASTTRAEQAEQERDVAIADERARIARELHDVVAHNVSVMVVQASAARQVFDTEPGYARDAMAAIEQVGQEAMKELRQMLDVLGEPAETPRDPQAGLDQLDALLARVRSAGLPVTVEQTGTPRPLPPGVDLTAYRVVQEGLTNVLRHAPGAATAVRVDYGDTELLVEVSNEPAGVPVVVPTQGGRGLVGLTERLHLYHGELTAGPRLTGGYRVTARVPLEQP